MWIKSGIFKVLNIGLTLLPLNSMAVLPDFSNSRVGQHSGILKIPCQRYYWLHGIVQVSSFEYFIVFVCVPNHSRHTYNNASSTLSTEICFSLNGSLTFQSSQLAVCAGQAYYVKLVTDLRVPQNFSLIWKHIQDCSGFVFLHADCNLDLNFVVSKSKGIEASVSNCMRLMKLKSWFVSAESLPWTNIKVLKAFSEVTLGFNSYW